MSPAPHSRVGHTKRVKHASSACLRANWPTPVPGVGALPPLTVPIGSITIIVTFPLLLSAPLFLLLCFFFRCFRSCFFFLVSLCFGFCLLLFLLASKATTGLATHACLRTRRDLWLRIAPCAFSRSVRAACRAQRGDGSELASISLCFSSFIAFTLATLVFWNIASSSLHVQIESSQFLGRA